MTDMTPEQARAALAAADRARRDVAEEIGLPRAYWWAMAGGWLVLGLLGQFAPWWVVTVATALFGAGHAAVASRLLDGRRRSSRLQVSRTVADRRIPLIVIAILLTAVAFTIALAFALQADGAGHPSLWAAVITALVVGFGGPEMFTVARRWIGA
ncbi:hypothetical protein [Gordonia sp. SL306]|uniref:hypothetical protein n=1 Tax=Gordonia sp. SL306 TaxID=2995145 RepID=UPI00226D8622|nr:hypothetical protein [Gordonia sp. SL306]WAC56713.1 hypothetical protein OVA31_05500 [Gordonia sp. SL306]